MSTPGGPQDHTPPPEAPQDWAPPAAPAPPGAPPSGPYRAPAAQPSGPYGAPAARPPGSYGAPAAPAPPGSYGPPPAPPGSYGPPATTPPGPYGAPPAGGYGWYGSPAAGLPMSSAGRRFGAYLLEGLLIVVTLFIGWIIWSLVVWSNGQTPAKQLLHMRCVDQSTQRAASWGTMALRELVGKYILGNATCGITTLVSAFMILGDSRRGVWDQIASTIVVDDPHDVLAT
jgi:uncharacterized RDD family membrane protein YckC